MTAPLSMVCQSVPEIVSGFACLSRVQAFLECETREDIRQPLEYSETLLRAELVVQDGNFGYETNNCILRNMNFGLYSGSLNMVVGPVASGKSTLCKPLLDELPISEGNVYFRMRHSHIGYCNQTAYLFNASMRENIVGFSAFNSTRYSEVVKATGLNYDLARLPQGDESNVGSDGLTLSGGQKQRVSLARALYLQADLLVLDDVFSGLDAETEEHVFDQVFGLHGISRKRGTTVFLCTNSVRHLPAADHIIVLRQGRIVVQGNFDHLKTSEVLTHYGLSQKSTSTPSKMSTELPTQTQPQLSVMPTKKKAALAPNIDATRQSGDRTVFKHYVNSMGVPLAVCSGLFTAFWDFLTNLPTVWLTFWTSDTKTETYAHSDSYYIGIYGLLQACTTMSLVLHGVAIFISSVKRVGASMHRDAFQTLVQAPLAFFTNTDTGVTTNLF